MTDVPTAPPHAWGEPLLHRLGEGLGGADLPRLLEIQRLQAEEILARPRRRRRLQGAGAAAALLLGATGHIADAPLAVLAALLLLLGAIVLAAAGVARRQWWEERAIRHAGRRLPAWPLPGEGTIALADPPGLFHAGSRHALLEDMDALLRWLAQNPRQDVLADPFWDQAFRQSAGSVLLWTRHGRIAMLHTPRRLLAAAEIR